VSEVFFRRPSEVLLSRVPKVLWGRPEVFWRVPFRLSEISLGMLGVPQLPQVL
jgi:hypothetical protein